MALPRLMQYLLERRPVFITAGRRDNLIGELQELTRQEEERLALEGGNLTRQQDLLSSAFRDIGKIEVEGDPEGAHEQRAERLLDIYFSQPSGETTNVRRVIGVKGNATRVVYQPAAEAQEVLIGRWVFKRLPGKAHSALEAGIFFPTELGDETKPWRRSVGKYLLEEEIPGDDLFGALLSLQQTALEGATFLIETLAKKALADLAYFQTHLPDIPSSISVIQPNYAHKFPETLQQLGITNAAAAQTAQHLGTTLDEGPLIPFRDAGLWNARIAYHNMLEALNQEGRVDSLISAYNSGSLKNLELLPKLLVYVSNGVMTLEEVAETLVGSTYQIDFEKVNRRTTLSDDAIHILDSPVTGFDPDKRVEMETYLAGELQRQGPLANLGAYWEERHVATVYRNLRFVLHYHESELPVRCERQQQFHLERATEALAALRETVTKPEGLDNIIHAVQNIQT